MNRKQYGFTQTVAVGMVTIMPDRDEILVNARPVSLTPAERAILRVLAGHRGSVVTRTELMMAAWNSGAALQTGELEALVVSLRDKLTDGGVTITSVPGIGYSLD